MKKIIVVIMLVMSSSLVIAQSNLVLYDADGDRIGTLIDIDYTENGYLYLAYTDDGYFVEFFANTGKIPGQVSPHQLFYQSNDCSGQPFAQSIVYRNSLSYLDVIRGGEILPHLPGNSVMNPAYVKLNWGKPEWSSGKVPVHYQSWESQDCVGETGEIEGWPVEKIDYLLYGISNLPGGGSGFNPPITATVEKSELISCDGFESCPTVEGPRGYTSLISQASEDAGDNCSAGGLKIQSGIDTSEDGILDPVEIDSTHYICNGISP
ncbi:hypothetical protein ACFL1V_07925 [Pseudomonadota bacterium]